MAITTGMDGDLYRDCKHDQWCRIFLDVENELIRLKTLDGIEYGHVTFDEWEDYCIFHRFFGVSRSAKEDPATFLARIENGDLDDPRWIDELWAREHTHSDSK